MAIADDYRDLESFIHYTQAHTHPTVRKSIPHIDKFTLNDMSYTNPFQSKDETQNDKSETMNLSNVCIKSLPIHYANAQDLVKLLSDHSNNLLSPKGHILADSRTNILYIQDIPSNISQIKSFISKIDIPSQQVLIKSQIVTADDTFLRVLGSIFTSKTAKEYGLNGLIRDPGHDSSIANSIRFPILKFQNGFALDMEITALENQGHAKLISSPQLVTLNRMPAVIASGEEIPYQEATLSGGTSVVFKKAVLELKVTPQIMPHNSVLLQLSVNQDKVSPLVVNGEPAISTQQLQTQVLVKSGQTIVLGGIYEQENSEQQTGVPGLRKIPIVGKAFSQNKQIHNRRQLLIFITPKIMN